MSKVITNQGKINEVLEKGVERVYPNKKALEKKLKSGKKIRVYCGFDPTSPNLHLGNAIQIRKLSQFQQLGHEVIFLIGDFTALIGDPTDKTAVRKRLTKQEVEKNLKNYKQQAGKILNFSGKNPAKLKLNSNWNNKLNSSQIVDLAFNFTVQQFLVRDMFQKRLDKDKPIVLAEFLYPLFQAYDSVAMDIDLEIGGNDQTFNMLRGRDLMNKLKNKQKFVLTTKLLEDPTGKKMGKTEGNVVNLNDDPKQIYGKIMSWPDSLIFLGFELCTPFSLKEINELKEQGNNPRDDKAKLAQQIVTVHYGKRSAQKAEQEFNRVFKQKKVPLDMKTYSRNKLNGISDIATILTKTNLASSKAEAKRLIEQGAVKLNDKPIKDWEYKITLKKGAILKVGKRKFIQFV